jgi:deazaflavin-dependent oxidoreductase (nitroreductase family)
MEFRFLSIKYDNYSGANAMNPSLNHFIRRFNKHIFNRFSRLLAGIKGSPWNLLIHQGRKSGHSYTTPIVSIAADGHYFIPLPYGEDVDWLRNVLHQGGAILKKDGEWFAVDNPQVVPTAQALPKFSAKAQQFMGRYKHIQNYLQLDRSQRQVPRGGI